MKKFLAILLAGLMVFSLCACKKGGEPVAIEQEAEAIVGDMVKSYETAMANGDGKTLFELTVDPYDLERSIERGFFDDKEDALKIFEEDGKQIVEYLEGEYGTNLQVTTEVTNNIRYSEEDVKKVNQALVTEYEYPENYISALQVVEVKSTIKGDSNFHTESGEYVAAKVNDRWYLNNLPGAYNKSSIEKILEIY